MAKIKALVLSGMGINCHKETARAFDMAGAETSTIPLGMLKEHQLILRDYQILALPGGFSYGDEIQSGRVLALYLKKYLGESLYQFAEKGHPILGICNGFQTLAELGLLSPKGLREDISLIDNDHGKFEDRWVDVKVTGNTHCLWTKGIGVDGPVHLPLRNKQGRLVATDSYKKHLSDNSQLKALTYSTYENGSYEHIAGLTNKGGNILGLMPHPEACVLNLQTCNNHHPFKEGAGLKFFINAVEYLK